MAPFVQRPDEKLAAVARSAPRKLQALVLGADDTIIVCAGFEDRALAALSLALKGSERFNILVVGYALHLTSNHEDKIRAMVEAHPAVSVSHLSYDRENPTGFGAVLVEAAGQRKGRIYIDISGMSRLLIVQTLVAFGGRTIGMTNCSLLYSEAAEYPPTKDEAEVALRRSTLDPTFSALFLSSGVFDITIVPELSSTAPAPTQSRLVVFPGFDVHHLTALRAELQPSRITFIEGIPPNPINHWRQKMIADLNHLESIPEAERIATCTLHYDQTLNALLGLYQHHGLRERLLIAPTGSKMQTVAVGLFRAYIEDVQIVYSTPRAFVSPDNYTRGVGSTYELPLDSFAAVSPVSTTSVVIAPIRGSVPGSSARS